MKTSAQIRLARLSGLVLLSLLVVTLAVQAAQAAQVQGSGSRTLTTAQLPTLAQIRQHSGVGASAGTLTTAQLPTLAQIRQHNGVGASAGTFSTAQLPTLAQIRQHNGVGAAQPPASSGISSATVWMAAVAVFGALLIGSWALAVRRRRQSEAAPGCEASALGC